MGFSTSGASAVLVVAAIAGISLAVPAFFESVTTTMGAANTVSEINTKAQDTDIDITDVVCSNGDLVVSVYNNGSTTLTVSKTDLLLNGDFQHPSTYTTTVNGSADKPIWFPGETLNISVNSPPPTDSVRVTSEYKSTAETNYTSTC